jgi:hypothetical protein
VQGQLRGESLSFVIDTSCGETGRPIRLEIDTDLNYQIVEGSPELLLFVPLLDFARLDDPSIIDAF